jgi:hypothetical protein
MLLRAEYVRKHKCTMATGGVPTSGDGKQGEAAGSTAMVVNPVPPVSVCSPGARVGGPSGAETAACTEVLSLVALCGQADQVGLDWATGVGGDALPPVPVVPVDTLPLWTSTPAQRTDGGGGVGLLSQSVGSEAGASMDGSLTGTTLPGTVGIDVVSGGELDCLVQGLAATNGDSGFWGASNDSLGNRGSMPDSAVGSGCASKGELALFLDEAGAGGYVY